MASKHIRRAVSAAAGAGVAFLGLLALPAHADDLSALSAGATNVMLGTGTEVSRAKFQDYRVQTCTTQVCTVAFPDVLPKTRQEVTYASCSVSATSQINSALLQVVKPNTAVATAAILPLGIPAMVSGYTYSAAAPTFVFATAGQHFAGVGTVPAPATVTRVACSITGEMVTLQ